MGCFATMQLLFAQLMRRGVSPAAILVVVFAVGAIFYGLHVRMTRTPVPHDGSAVIILIVAAP